MTSSDITALTAIGLNNLAHADAAGVSSRNADLAVLARRIYRIGGAQLRFVRSEAPAADTQAPAIWLWLEWAGVPLLAGISPAWAAAALQTVGVALEQLAENSLDLLCQTHLAPQLPAGLIVRQAAISRTHLQAPPRNLAPIGCWSGVHHDTGEATGHTVHVEAGPQFALRAFLQLFDPFVCATLASPLARMPIGLPLVAARWQVAANDLQDLAVGDVLVLG